MTARRWHGNATVASCPGSFRSWRSVKHEVTRPSLRSLRITLACLLYAMPAVFGITSQAGADETASSILRAAQPNDRPFDEHWWPTEWGSEDKVGAPNRTNPDTVLAALKLVKRGKTATLGKLYAADIPLVGNRNIWHLTIPGTPTGGPFGDNQVVYHDELVTTQIGQVGTQFDGPGHVGIRTSKGDYFYNGRNREKSYARGPGNTVTGMGELGVEFVAEKGFVCRGLLLNAAAYKGLPRLPVPDSPESPGIVSADDVRGMIKAQGVEPPGEGDCVFLYTGHGDLWSNEVWASLDEGQKSERRRLYNEGEPGFSLSACQYLASRKVILTGGDTSADAGPVTEVPGSTSLCHIELQTRHGIWNLENLDFKPLLDDRHIGVPVCLGSTENGGSD